MTGRAVVIVTSYNYADYIAATLHSALNQTRLPDCIIVIDDGSTDGSPDLIRKIADQHPRIQLIEKKNGGQLSAFNAAAGLVRDDDLVFFLDADDIYPPDYISEICRHAAPDIDFMFAVDKIFTPPDTVPLASCILSDAPPVPLASTSALTRHYQCWIGSPTSAIALRGKLFRQILPYPDEAAWISRADDILVYASCILGASKLHLPGIGISYRAHGENAYFGREFDAEYETKRVADVGAVFDHYCAMAGIPRDPSLKELGAAWNAFPDALRNRGIIPRKISLRKVALRRLKRRLRVLLGLT